jgi:hypothetical protein
MVFRTAGLRPAHDSQGGREGRGPLEKLGPVPPRSMSVMPLDRLPWQHVETLLRRPYLLTGDAHRPGGGRRRLFDGANRLRQVPAALARVPQGQSKGPRAGAGHRSRHPDGNAGHAGPRRPALPGRRPGANRRPVHLRRDAGLQQLSLLDPAHRARPSHARPSLGRRRRCRG